LRLRSTRIGTSGFSTRTSMTKKATIITIARANHTRVDGSVQ